MNCCQKIANHGGSWERVERWQREAPRHRTATIVCSFNVASWGNFYGAKDRACRVYHRALRRATYLLINGTCRKSLYPDSVSVVCCSSIVFGPRGITPAAFSVCCAPDSRFSLLVALSDGLALPMQRKTQRTRGWLRVTWTSRHSRMLASQHGFRIDLLRWSESLSLPTGIPRKKGISGKLLWLATSGCNFVNREPRQAYSLRRWLAEHTSSGSNTQGYPPGRDSGRPELDAWSISPGPAKARSRTSRRVWFQKERAMKNRMRQPLRVWLAKLVVSGSEIRRCLPVGHLLESLDIYQGRANKRRNLRIFP